MALKEKDRLEWEEILRDREMITADDVIEEFTLGDYWDFIVQTRGRFFFTRDKIIFMSGFGFECYDIKYSDIREIKKCLICFFPFGIRITADNQNGKTKKYKFSLLKRMHWMELLSRKSGVSF